MAGGWIKMRVMFGRDGRVRQLSRSLATNVTHVCGALYLMWSLADEIADEQAGGGALMRGYKPADLDEHVGIQGFTYALPECWMEVTDDGLYLPNYTEHNGTTGKKRATDQKRQKVRRGNVAKASRLEATKRLPEEIRGDKRREDNIGLEATPAQPNDFADQTDRHRADAFQAMTRLLGRTMTFSDDKPVERYAEALAKEDPRVDGKPVDAWELVCRAISNAIEQEKEFSTVNAAMKYVKSICERCLNDEKWPGEFKGRNGDVKRPNKPLPATKRILIEIQADRLPEFGGVKFNTSRERFAATADDKAVYFNGKPIATLAECEQHLQGATV